MIIDNVEVIIVNTTPHYYFCHHHYHHYHRHRNIPSSSSQSPVSCDRIASCGSSWREGGGERSSCRGGLGGRVHVAAEGSAL
jgi:hypothetical protein